MDRLPGSWINREQFESEAYKCGYCGEKVASSTGYYCPVKGGALTSYVRLCSHCNRPTFFDSQEHRRMPDDLPGNSVDSLPGDVEELYREARGSVSVGAFSGSVLLSRKLLMHIAVEKGSDQKSNFLKHVNYLHDNHYIPFDSKGWVDYIRQKGNESNHEIVISSREEAIGLLSFVEMLMKIVYEMPSSIPQTPNVATK